jgi:radical SAM superfamily enzyme
MRIDITVKDGTVIKGCCIYPEDVKNGDSNITDKKEIDMVLSKVPWGKKYISFQNEFINGHIHVNNILEYIKSE